MFKWLTAGVIILLLAGPLNAQRLNANDPDSLLIYLKSEGLKAHLEKDDYGDPKIVVHHGGSSFSMYFYGCTSGRNCTSIQFFTGYRTEGAWTIEQANAWNKERRYTRAYVSEGGSARLEMDVHSGTDGFSDRGFANHFKLWTRNMTDFEGVIGW